MALSLIGVWLLGSAVLAQASSKNCLDDRGVNRCAEEQQRSQRKLYQAQAVDEHAQRGEQVRRVFYVDGYGGDVALVSFIRVPGRDIAVEVRTPPKSGLAGSSLTAAVPLLVWEEVTAASRQIDRMLVPRASEEPNLCTHSWVYTAEASDPAPQGQTRPSLRRAVEDACQDGLVQPFALSLAQQALDLLPPCRVINPEQHRNAVSILAACTRLSGDRIAAALAMNYLHSMGFGNHPKPTPEMRSGFGHRVRFDINGQVTEYDSLDASAFWIRQRGPLGSGFTPDSYHGERWDRVVVRGHLWRPGEAKQKGSRAPMAIIMAWGAAQSFQIREIRLGNFAPVS